MGERQVLLRENTTVTACPKCGNNTRFTARSEQCAEDSCEVWVICKCGYDPTFGRPCYRYEDVWGGTDPGNVQIALDVWSDLIAEEGAAV